MKVSSFSTLTPIQQTTLLIAVQVRTSIEDFHVTDLSDVQMKSLQSAYSARHLHAMHRLEDAHGHKETATLAYLIAMIPDYWEIPDCWRDVQEIYNPRSGTTAIDDSTT